MQFSGIFTSIRNNATMSTFPPAALIPLEENRGSHERQELYLIMFRNVVVLVVFTKVVVAALAILGGNGIGSSSSSNSSGINNSVC